MDNYSIVLPENFSAEHKDYIEKFKNSIEMISAKTDIILGVKDVNSRHIISTNQYASIVGLKSGNDVANRLDQEMPCDGTRQYADCYVQEDVSLMNTLDINKSISVLNVHNYNDGLKARIFKKHILSHEASRSILGTIYSGHDVELSSFLNIMPSYIIKFGATGSVESINSKTLINGVYKLNNYEQEICFLLLLNWDFKQIAQFMNQYRPAKMERTADTIIKKKNYICGKLRLVTNQVDELRGFLVSIGFHNKMPDFFYNRIIGSKVLNEISLHV
jgi:hypothetical protein